MESQNNIELDKDIIALSDATHLERERAQTYLESEVIPNLTSLSEVEQELRITGMLNTLDSMLKREEKWELKYGCLVGYKILLSQQVPALQQQTSKIQQSIGENIFEDKTFKALLENQETRVSQQLAALVSVYFKTQVPWGELIRNQFLAIQDILMKQQKEQLIPTCKEVFPSSQQEQADQTMSKEQLLNQNQLSKLIEANMLLFKALIESSGIENIDLIEIDQIMEFYARSPNRHIRELNQFLLLSVLSQQDSKSCSFQNLLKQSQLASLGMMDNWSQVRFAAAQTSRRIYDLLKHMQVEDKDKVRDEIDKLLLPRICFNRHYMAEGIRNYNQDTWKQIVGQEGKDYLARLSREVTDFYISQLHSENFQVREVATECFDEIFRNVASQDAESYRLFLNIIIENLLLKVKDTQWQVRKGVFITASEIFKIYTPEDLETTLMNQLKEEIIKYLSENIPTVREAAAVAAAVIYSKDINILNNEFKEVVLKYLTGNLLAAKQQQLIKASSGIPYDVKFEVDKSKAQSEEQKMPQLITPNVAVHLKGVEDPGFAREEQLWEKSDGSIYLFREVANLLDSKTFSKLISQIPDLGYLDQFTEASLLKENLFRSLSEIIKKVGKKHFRPYVELFIDPTFRAAKDPRFNCQYPAQEFVMNMVKEYGESIMKAVVESHDDRLMNDLVDIIQRNKAGHFNQQQQNFGGFPPNRFPPGAGAFQGQFQPRY